MEGELGLETQEEAGGAWGQIHHWAVPSQTIMFTFVTNVHAQNWPFSRELVLGGFPFKRVAESALRPSINLPVKARKF